MLYLIRHGQTEFNLIGKLQGTCDSPLTEKGISEAKKLGERLSGVNFSKAYSSALGRAFSTAEIILGERDIPIERLEDANEMSFGSWEGVELGKIMEDCREAYTLFWEEPEKYVPENGAESFEDLFKRIEKVKARLFKEAAESDILLVSHGVWIKAFLNTVLNKELKDLWEPPHVKNTALTLINTSGGNAEIVLLGDLSHLE